MRPISVSEGNPGHGQAGCGGELFPSLAFLCSFCFFCVLPSSRGPWVGEWIAVAAADPQGGGVRDTACTPAEFFRILRPRFSSADY